MDKDAFYQEFRQLEDAFAKLEPELAETLQDSELGVEGYVVVWNTDVSVGGPLERSGKGGTRITPTVTLDEVKMLARIMALKNAAAGLPLGGAKSGLRADPTAEGFEKKYRRFVELAKPLLRENGGIFGGFGFDIGARPEHALWACDELGSINSFTGKPINLGGTDYDNEGIAGLGVAVAAKSALEVDKKNITSTTFAVQGCGAMGAAVIRYFSEYGASLRVISDPSISGTFVLKESASPELVASLVAQDFESARDLLESEKELQLGLDDVLYQDVDVLFPCAVQDVVRADNVSKLRCHYFVEGANNPCSSEARTSLFERGVRVLPDFIANPGGVIAAYIELSSDVTPEENVKTCRKVEQAKSYTREKIQENIEQMLSLADRLQIEPVHAGKYIALKNILQGGGQS